MNSYNLGCGPGGGDDALQVFQTAGLAFSDGDRLTQTKEGKDGVSGDRQRRKGRVCMCVCVSDTVQQTLSSNNTPGSDLYLIIPHLLSVLAHIQ